MRRSVGSTGLIAINIFHKLTQYIFGKWRLNENRPTLEPVDHACDVCCALRCLQ